ncbi:MAG: amidohydrolase family protein [Pigmentiphaga sp.]|nr:amidohydrolase family protein [Pigmentiphaga sp.]
MMSLQHGADRPLVDTHVHIFKRDMPLVPEPRHRPQYDFTVEQLLAVLDAHGVSHAVVAAASPWGDYNDYTLASLRKSRRLRGTIIAQPSIERAILNQMDEAGIVGVRLSVISMKSLPDLDSWEYRKFLHRLADLGWHVHVHADIHQLPAVLPALERAGVKTVIDHIGRPDPVAGTDSDGFRAMVSAVQRGRAWVKLSAAYRLGGNARDCARALLRAVGCDRLFWASDCPFVGAEARMTYQESIDWLNETIDDADARRRIFGENALRFYFS